MERPDYYNHRLYNGDFNGDGLIDYLLYFPDYLNGYIRYPKSGTGSEKFTFPDGWTENVIPMDYNGNGKTDFLCKNGTTSNLFEYDISTNSLLDVTDAGAITLEDWHAAYPGDFNGDGKSDILFFSKNDNKWKIYYSKGSGGFVLKDAPLTSTNNPSLGTDNHCFVGDYNGDRFTDILEIDIDYITTNAVPFEENGRARFTVYYGNGSGFISESTIFEDLIVETNIEEEDPYGGTYIRNIRLLTFNANAFHFADLNGDGSLDCFYKDAKKTTAQVINFHQSEKRNLVASIANGLDNKAEFIYLPASDDVVYNTGSGNNLNNTVIESRQPINLVYQMKQPTGIGVQVNISQFKYQGLKIHKTGRGFLGFEKVTTTNDFGYDLENEYLYNPTFFNVYLSNSKTKLGTTLISETNYPSVTTESLDGGKRFRSYVSQKVETDHLNSISITSNFAYDAYGNITSQEINHDGEGISKVTNTYLKLNGWCDSELDVSTTEKTRTGDTEIHSRTVDNNYDLDGQLYQTIADGVSTLKLTTSYLAYNPFGLPEKITVAGSGKTKTKLIGYDSKGRAPIKKVLKGPDGVDFVTEKTYDYKTGNVLTEKDILGNVTSYAYDALGQLTQTTLPNGNKVIQSVNWANGAGPSGCLYFTETNRDGSGSSRIYYDILGRELRKETTGFDGIKIHINTYYDEFGRMAAKSEPRFEGQTGNSTITSFETSTGRIDYITTPTGIIEYDYPNNKQTKITNQASQVVTKTINAYGEVVNVQDEGGYINYFYDPAGLPKSISAENSGTIILDYDIHGNRTSITDPNLDVPVTSIYDAFDNLTNHTDANGNYTMIYDNMDRLTSRTGNDQPTAYTYVMSGNGLGQLKTVSYNSIVQSYGYDSYGRITKLTETMDGTDFDYSYTYDQYGRKLEQIYPEGKNVTTNFSTTNVYNQFGYLDEIKQTGGATIWKANAMNAVGQYKQITKGNGKITNYTYDAYHRPETALTTGILEYEYSFDPKTGNLLSRTDRRRGKTESFKYDNLNRLNSGLIDNVPYLNMSYDKNGNILSKSDAGTYGYGTLATRPHAVLEVTNPQSTIPSAEQKISYTAFNKVSLIEEWDTGQPKNTLTFTYGADQQRRKTIFNDGTADVLTKYFMGAYEEEIDALGQSRKLYYIGGGDGLAAVYIVEGGTGALHYTYTDHLGSILAVTNALGGIEQEQSFDPWGRRRNVSDWTYSNIQTFNILDRGYTGHQHLYAFNIINMNGRLYDPVLGRMLGPDPYIQMLEFTQNFNRYSYVLNNPLLYIDPSGYNWLNSLFNKVNQGFHNLFNNIEQGFRNFGNEAWHFVKRDILRPICDFVGGIISVTAAAVTYAFIVGVPVLAALVTVYIAPPLAFLALPTLAYMLHPESAGGKFAIDKMKDVFESVRRFTNPFQTYEFRPR